MVEISERLQGAKLVKRAGRLMTTCALVKGFVSKRSLAAGLECGARVEERAARTRKELGLDVEGESSGGKCALM